MKTLILDNTSISSRALMLDLLEIEINKVALAQTEEQAFKYLEQAENSDYPIGLILIAWELPPIDASKFIKKLRIDDRYKATIVISIIRSANEEKVKSAIKSGSSSVMARPVDIKKLSSIIDGFL